MKCLSLLVSTVIVPLTVFAQTTVFSDNFSSSTLNGVSIPTATSTSYDIASSKAATTGPTIGSGDLKLCLNAATGSGFVEAQALFTTSPITLATVGDYINLTYVFTDTANLLAGGTSSYIITGLYNSGGAAPLAGSLNSSGLNTTAGSAYATGNAAGWAGYVGRIGSAAQQAYTRPIQNGAGTTSANQDLIGNNWGGGAFNNPTGATLGGGTTAAITLNNLSVYTLSYTITLTAAGTLSINDSLYSGSGTGGTQLCSQTGTATGATLLTSTFDGLAIGLRNSGTSYNPTMDISQLTVTDYIQPIPEPASMAIAGFGLLALAMVRRARR